ncbi:AAA family ATPase [Oscillochloris sp. ZM17-4]|uniref:ATP-binding protein n=1 Tax=Oscillochloris sp. ZM17-4 TaxID=2866714 RepID=UPI001C72A91E|nr:SbcC/MukB-like Walker B domain-containing protein [Oscillochloris sp. ZM17-4]MBX0328596.1 AAA family ATPase [Oscillochloris sp. ZM17-4]
MLSLTRIFLYNWHRFDDHMLDVEDSLYLAGHNGAGKSSVLDAIQVALIADQGLVRFNTAANDRSSQRNLDSYVRGKIGEGRYLRPGNTVAYIALEFTERSRGTVVTVGACIECGDGRSAERTFFILGEGVDRELLIPGGRPRTRRELKQELRGRRGARSYDTIGEYQVELLNRLGGLHERFFDLFLRALTFQPIRDIREFVERWLLEDQPLAIEALQRVVERLAELDASAREVEEKLGALQVIVDRQVEVRRLRDLHATWSLLCLLLTHAAGQRRVAGLERQIDEVARRVERAHAEHAQAERSYQNASQALLDVRVQLEQSDVIRRRGELSRQIDAARELVARITDERGRLFRELGAILAALRPLLAAPALAAAERAALDALADVGPALDQAAPPPEGLAPSIDAAISGLDTALERVRQDVFEVERRARELRDRHAEVSAQLARLRQGRKSYPPQVERLQELLTPIVGSRPPLLCELLEVPDERWQNAVEALLGGRRFTIIVPPERFEASLRELDRARAAEGLRDASILDLSRSGREGRPAQGQSLAKQVQVKVRSLLPYIDSVLGDIICCEDVGELRRHRRAVTPEVVLYSEWAVRAMPQRSFEPWFVGGRAAQSQIAARERELAELDEELAALAPRLRDLRALARGLDQGRALSNLRQRLDADLDDRPLAAQIAGWELDLRALDLSGVRALEDEARRLAGVVEAERRMVERLGGDIRLAERDQEQLQASLHAARRALAEAEDSAAAGRARYAHVADAAEGLLQERRDSDDLAEATRNAEIQARGFETRAQNELNRLVGEGTTYNTRYQFAGRPDPDDEVFAREQARLGATELPRYREQIAVSRREADEELREHVLHRLREQILGARQQLSRINDALGRLDFHGERYRFVSAPADDLREYYDLINEAQVIGAGSLFESSFYESHKGAFDLFYEALTRAPQSEAERSEQKRLTDYRSYLSYDIEVTHAGGQVSRLSRIMGQTSGGETQTPFYLTIAASFVQLYHIGERTTRPTIRLVAFDEAFSKMDQDRIGATLDLFQQFGLQVITATPLERCEYLVPKMCTSLVLTGVGDTVLVEPYRNYASRLGDFAEKA